MGEHVNMTLMTSAAVGSLNLVLADDGNVWRYQDGVYLPDGMKEAEHYVKEELGSEVKLRHIHEIRGLLTSGRLGMVLDQANSLDYLNVRNGLYEWGTGKMHAHTPDHFYTYQLPHYWDNKAVCPIIDASLERALPDPHDREVFWEWAGYCLLPGNRYKKALILYGSGDTGKTVALHVLTNLMGKANVSAVPLQDLADNRFAAVQLVGKLANIADDIGDASVRQSGRFKAITGNGAIMVEAKGLPAFSYTVPAKLIYAANDLPGTADMSDAYFGRWHIIPFAVPVTPQERRTGIFDEVAAPDEMAGALVRAVAGAHRILARGSIAVSDSMRATVDEYREDADSVVAWLGEHVTTGEGSWCSRPDAYASFRAFAEGERRGIMKAPTFYKRLRAAGVSECKKGQVRGFGMVLSGQKGSF